MIRRIYPILALLVISTVTFADVFTNVKTGEKFYGFATQRTMDSKMRVFEQIDDSFNSRIINYSEYKIEYDIKGRRDLVIVVPFNQKEALISKAVADTIAQTIADASDRGPIAVLLEIDNPGGRGDYMNIITKAITDTANCPVVAYITDNIFGGAYSTAAAVALACDKIYISPTAAIGSVAPAHGALTAQAGFEDFAKTYNPANIAAYSAYVSKLAENHNRPGVFGAALMDKTIEVIEVASGSETETKNYFINSIDQIPAQQFVKRWTHRINAVGISNDMHPGSYDSREPKTTNILTLIGDEAAYCRIADKVANSQAEVLADLGAAGSRVIKSSTAHSVSQLFLKNTKSMDRLLSSIEQREEISDTIESQLSQVITKQNNKIDIRVVGENENSNYSGRNSSNIYSTSDVYSTHQRKELRKQQRVSQQQQQTNSYNQYDQDDIMRIRLARDLGSVLNGLASDYKQVIAIGRKFPGTMPSDVSVVQMQSRLTAVRMKLRSYNLN